MVRTIDDRYEMLDAWKSGKTFEEIGKEYGISKQRVHQIVSKLIENDLSNVKVKDVLYSGLKLYMYVNHISFHALAMKCDCSDYLLKNALVKEGEIKIDLIRRILKITGMNFEECFWVEQDSN